MKYLLFFLIILSLYTFNFYRHIQTHVYPRTYLSYINLSGKNDIDLSKALKEQFNKTIKIQVKDRVYEYPYETLGIYLDTVTTERAILEPNTRNFPRNIIAYLHSFKATTTYFPTLVFTQDFYRFTEESIFDFSPKPDAITIDPEAKQLVVQKHEEKYRIDAEQLKKQIIYSFGANDHVKPLLVKIEDDTLEQLAKQQNERIHKAFTSPVTVVAHDGNNLTRVTFSPKELKTIVSLAYNDRENKIDVKVDESKLQENLDKHKSVLGVNSDKNVSENELKDDLISLINSRMDGQNTQTLLTKVDYVPNTDGSRTNKYIEVDISQQSMYLFENGTIKERLRISSGLYYPTPRGEFKIMNKAFNAFSNIYNVWMPYWMAFYYDPKLKAYFGIHELPYWISRNGEKIQRPREFIGTPKTGGCVALDIGASQRVYAFADIGTPVYIFD